MLLVHGLILALRLICLSSFVVSPNQMDNLRETLAAARADGTEVRGIAVINPGNPTGNILAEEQIKDIIKVKYVERKGTTDASILSNSSCGRDRGVFVKTRQDKLCHAQCKLVEWVDGFLKRYIRRFLHPSRILTLICTRYTEHVQLCQGMSWRHTNRKCGELLGYLTCSSSRPVYDPCKKTLRDSFWAGRKYRPARALKSPRRKMRPRSILL